MNELNKAVIGILLTMATGIFLVLEGIPSALQAAEKYHFAYHNAAYAPPESDEKNN